MKIRDLQRVALWVACLFFCAPLSAQYRVGGSGIKENWFIGAGVGGQFFYGDHNRQMDFLDRIVPAFELHGGKWFTSGLGLRLGLNGLKNRGLTQNGSHSTGEVYDASKWLDVQEFNYIHVHGDVMFDIMNMIEGYDYQTWHPIPYVGLGLMATWEQPRSRAISASLGVFNTIYLNEFIDLTVDVRGSMVEDRFDGELGGRKDEGMLTAAVGIIYKINYQDWNRPRWEAPPRRGPRRAQIQSQPPATYLYDQLKSQKDSAESALHTLTLSKT